MWELVDTRNSDIVSYKYNSIFVIEYLASKLHRNIFKFLQLSILILSILINTFKEHVDNFIVVLNILKAIINISTSNMYVLFNETVGLSQIFAIV